MAGRKPRNEIAMTSTERSRLSRENKRKDRAAKVASTSKPPIAKKKVKPRQKRSDSTDVITRAMENVDKPALMPPCHLRFPVEALNYWHAIIETRGRDDWTPVDLLTAAALAKCQLAIADEELILEHEGNTIVDYLGKVMVNPRFAATETLHKRAMALMRTLRIGGKAAGELGGLVGGRVIENTAKQIKEETDNSDGLLA